MQHRENAGRERSRTKLTVTFLGAVVKRRDRKSNRCIVVAVSDTLPVLNFITKAQNHRQRLTLALLWSPCDCVIGHTIIFLPCDFYLSFFFRSFFLA